MAIDDMTCDYRRDFGITLMPHDAARMLVLANMFLEVFEKYENDLDCSTDLLEFVAPLLDL